MLNHRPLKTFAFISRHCLSVCAMLDPCGHPMQWDKRVYTDRQRFSRALAVRFIVCERQLTALDEAMSKIKAITLISVRHSHAPLVSRHRMLSVYSN